MLAELCATGRYASFFAPPMEKYPTLVRLELEDTELFVEQYLIINRRAWINPAAEEFISWTKERFAA